VRDYLATPRPGADVGYVVVPRSLAEAMPLPWQQHMAYLLSEFHQAFSHITWPTYRVVPSRYEKLVDLEDAFRQWRFRHATTVERIIVFKRGTGGTSGVGYLRGMLDVVLFPELWRARTAL